MLTNWIYPASFCNCRHISELNSILSVQDQKKIITRWSGARRLNKNKKSKNVLLLPVVWSLTFLSSMRSNSSTAAFASHRSVNELRSCTSSSGGSQAADRWELRRSLIKVYNAGPVLQSSSLCGWLMRWLSGLIWAPWSQRLKLLLEYLVHMQHVFIHRLVQQHVKKNPGDDMKPIHRPADDPPTVLLHLSLDSHICKCV